MGGRERESVCVKERGGECGRVTGAERERERETKRKERERVRDNERSVVWVSARDQSCAQFDHACKCYMCTVIYIYCAYFCTTHAYCK